MEASAESRRRRRRRGAQTLVFVYLLILRAAADCPKPDGPENTVLSNEALLLNNYPDGTDVMLECGNGYETDSGSGLITCMDDRWTEPDLICKKKDCGPPAPMPHMNFNLSGGTLFGAKVKVFCDTGYHVSGSSFRQCLDIGWFGRGKCEIDTCEKLAGVQNGQIIWDSEEKPKYGEIVQIICDEGFRIVGKDTLTCSEKKKYDAEPPTCEGEPAEDRIKPDVSTATPATAQPGAGPSTRTTVTGDRKIMTTVSPDEEKTDPSQPPPSTPGERANPPAEADGPPPAVTATTASQGNNDIAVDTTRENGYLPVIISVVSMSVATSLVVLFIHKFIMRKKGSYDTREDLKPELLQFQNL